MEERERYWSDYYRRMIAAPEQLDYANDAVQAQTFGVALASSGSLSGKRCLDFGCGAGGFATALAALGAEVSGVDLVPEFIERNAKRAPYVRWLAGTFPDATLQRELGSFDLVFALEVLQLMIFRATFETLWAMVRPGGRVVVLVPNGACPIVQRVIARFEGKYDAPTADEVCTTVSALPDLETWHYAGLTFRDDQRVIPYDVTPWTTSPAWASPPNRFLISALRKG